MTMTMFRDFLDIRQDSKEIFDGLEIMKHQETVEKYMNKYPVIFMSLKEVSGTDFEAVFNNLRFAIANICKSFDDLYQNKQIDDDDKSAFRALKKQNANETNTIAALYILSRMLKQYYDKPVFVIIDEYDVPMARALNTPVYGQTREMIEKMLSYVCKTNENVKGVILSGCLYTVKNSTYTGLNNIIPYTVLNPNYASSIGFTDEEVKHLLSDANISDHYQTIKEWYDGYIFGREKMYCPWDVLRYVSSILDGSYSKVMSPESYWVNTSETSLDIIHGFLGKTPNANETFEKLLADKTIDCVVNENLTYHNIHSDGENIWSALLETGYLTKAVTERMSLMPLKIPNKSIKNVFRQEVWDFFRNKLDNVFIVIFSAMATGGSVIISQYVGGKEQERGIKAASQLLMIISLVAVVIAVFILTCGNWVFSGLFGTVERDVHDAGVLYLRICAASFLFLGMEKEKDINLKTQLLLG